MNTQLHSSRPEARRVLSLIEVIQALGASRSTVMRLIDAGQLKAVWMGGKISVLTSDLDAYIASLPPYPAKKGTTK